jgi:hypothetical protein
MAMDEPDRSGAVWTFPAGLAGAESVKGFEVEATDGVVGHVDWASYAPGESYLVVRVRHQLHPSDRVVPAGAVVAVDSTRRTLRLALTRSEVERSPEHHDLGNPVDLDPRFLAGLWPTWLNGRAE